MGKPPSSIRFLTPFRPSDPVSPLEFRNREDEDEVYTVRALPGEFNLHEHWHQWVTEFSDSPEP